MIRTRKDRWEQGFAALSKFRRRKARCCPPQRHLEGKYNLGAWVIVQRYRRDDLSVERKKRLDRIGFVWNWRDFAWERGFATLLKFKRREGHCRVHSLYRERKYKLGSWVWKVYKKYGSDFKGQGRGELGAGNFLFRGQCKIIEQQLLPPCRPSCRVSGVSPNKPHHDRIRLDRRQPTPRTF